MKSLRNLPFFLCIVLCSASAVEAASPQRQDIDNDLEQRLDGVLDIGFYPRNRAAFHEILGELDTHTPISTLVRARSYQALELALADNRFPDALEKSEAVIELAKQHDSPDALVEALAVRAELFLRSDQTTQALLIVPEVEALLPKASNPRILFYANHLIGRVLQESSQYEEALAYFLNAHDIIARTDDHNTQRRRQFVNLQIARIQSDLENNSAALELTQRTIEESLAHGLHTRLPDLYLLQGYIVGSEGPSEQALELYRQAIHWAETVGDDRVRLVGRNNVGSVLMLLDRLDEATDILSEGQQLAQQLERPREEALMQFNLGYIELLRGNADSGIATVEQAAQYYRQNARDSEVANLLGVLAQAYEMAELYQQQAQTLLEQQRIRDALFRSERDRAINELQIRYQAQEQRQQIQLLEQRSELQERLLENQQLQYRIIALFIIVVILALCLLFVAYRSARKANLRLNEANERLQDQSVRDPLTGLHNRRSLQQALISRERMPGEQDALFLLDIDLFKYINDREGHAAGDAVLVELANRLRNISRSSDMVIRWGGEEFLILLRGVNKEALPELARRVLFEIGQQPVNYQDKAISVTATGGFITLPFAGLDEQQLGWEKALQIADMSLYLGKSQGRNQITGVLGINKPFAEIEETLLNDLAAAVKNDWVTVTTISGPA